MRLFKTLEIMSYAWSRLLVWDCSSIIFCWLKLFDSSILDSIFEMMSSNMTSPPE